MGEQIFIAISNLIIPITLLIISAVNLPENINTICGYRTTMSMKNQETWKFANEMLKKVFKKMGIIMFIFTVIITIVTFLLSEDIQWIVSLSLVTIQTLAIIVSIFPMEKKLKETFDENGNRR